MRASWGRGSMSPSSVVPAVAMTRAGPAVVASARSRAAGMTRPAWQATVTGVGRPRSHAARWMLWWALVPQTTWTVRAPAARARSRARRRATRLDSVPPLVTRASGWGLRGWTRAARARVMPVSRAVAAGAWSQESMEGLRAVAARSAATATASGGSGGGRRSGGRRGRRRLRRGRGRGCGGLRGGRCRVRGGRGRGWCGAGR